MKIYNNIRTYDSNRTCLGANKRGQSPPESVHGVYRIDEVKCEGDRLILGQVDDDFKNVLEGLSEKFESSKWGRGYTVSLVFQRCV